MKKIVQTIDCGLFDGFPYVIHKEKRLFFPDCWSLAKVKSFYSNYIENERIVNTDSGIGPHQYQAPDFIIEKDDILVDVGCAESLLALDVIETIKYAYLIENDPIWAKPLELTFKPFADKVKIVTKTISNKDSGDEITLPTLLMNEPSDTKVFIKMDIEGGEMSLLEAAKEYLENQDNIKVACCTYHRIEDAANIESLLESSGYSCSFSTGYILTSFLDPCGIPSLRKGIIRALKKKD